MWEEKRSKMQIKSPAEILFSPVEQNRTLQELLGNSQRQGQHPISPPVIKKMMIDDDWYLVDRLVKGVGEMAKDGEDDGARQQGGERVRKTDDDGDDNYNDENHYNEDDGDGSCKDM